MIERYTRPVMGRLWSEENRLAKWLEVELLACEALAKRGEIPKDAIAKLRQGARVNVARMQQIEAEVKHDIIAFVSSVAETVGEEGRYLGRDLELLARRDHLAQAARRSAGRRRLRQLLQDHEGQEDALHLMGLCSDGQVHSSLTHLYALLKMAKDHGLERGVGASLPRRRAA